MPKVVKAGSWVLAIRMLNRLFSLARTIILARLLFPEDFGLLGMAMLTLSALETLTTLGLSEALIQRSERSDDDFHAAWTFQVLRSLALFFIAYLAAPWVEYFFKTPGLTPIGRSSPSSSTTLPPVTGEAGGIRNSVVSWSDAFPFTAVGEAGS